MVREQEPARNPLQPSQGNSQPQVRDMDKRESQQPASPAAQRTVIDLENTASPQPVFGRPTVLGASPQPFARGQPPSTRPANVGVQRQNTSKDAYSHLFIPSSKSVGHRPELHKPRPGGNPLSMLNRPPKPQSQNSAEPTQSKPRARYSSDDDVFEIPKPPTWQPQKVSYPTFSSQQNSNPFYQATPSADFGGSSQSTTNGSGLWDERYGSSDPYTFMDSAKANEQLKALFEGGLDDEQGKPRTRRRKKQLETKLDDLADQIKGLKVKSSEDETREASEAEDEEEEEEEDDGTREGLKVKLLPHQIDGVEWMRSKEVGRKDGKGKTGGGILADDMGLGKTIQSIALILTNPKPVKSVTEEEKQKKIPKFDKGTLVVAPLALIKQWEGEIKDRIDADHQLKVCVHHGPKRAKSFKELTKYDVVITTYSTLTSEHDGSSDKLPAGCFGVNWYRIILDEAHSIKNRNAKSTKAACALNAQYRWCLTGTPMQNNLEELQSLIHFLRIAPLDKFEYWREQIARPMSNGRGGLAIKRLQAVLANIMKRRTKDVLQQAGGLNSKKHGSESQSEFKLVKRTVEAVEAEFSTQERSFYNRLESKADQRLEMMMAGNKMSYASALVLLMRLRQACNHPKLIGSDLTIDKDNFADAGGQTPRKKASRAQDDDDALVAMLGGLTVQTKLCDVCQVELDEADARSGALRCEECQKDLDEQEALGKDKKQKKKDKKTMVKSDRKINRHVIIDSDDEDEEDSKGRIVDLTEETEDDDNDDEDDSSEDYDSEESEEEDEYSEILAADLIASTKIRHLLNILRVDAHKHKYIVFSVFTSMLDLIEPFLRQSHIKFVRYDGSMRNDLREASLNNLRHDPTVRVLLCSLRAGSLGLNLTAASRVVVLEPFWNPFVEEQAIDRVHRLNQTQDVIVYKLTIKDTVESRILELQEKKRALAKATVEGQKASGIMKLTMAEMLKLFDHGAERDAKVDMVGFQGAGGLLEAGESTGPSTRRETYEHEEPRRGEKDRERDHYHNRPKKDSGIYSRRW